MISFACWLFLGIASMAVELVFRPRKAGGASPEASLSDGLMRMAVVVALAGPLLLVVLLPGAIPPAFIAVGGVVGAFGVGFRGWAMKSLGARFQLSPMRQSDQHFLVVAGPYSLVRHPGYLAMCCQYLGMALLIAGPFALLFVLPFVAVVLQRISFEESILMSEFAPEYTAYREQTRWRVVPWVY